MKKIRNVSLLTAVIYSLLNVLPSPLIAQTGDLSQFIYLDGNDAVVDVNRLTFGDFPAVQSAGEFKDHNGKTFIRWQKGDQFVDLVSLGDISTLGIQKLTVEQIATSAGANPDNIAIAAVKLYTQQSVNNLVDAVPGLKDVELGAAQPILELADQYARAVGKAYLGNLAQKTIGDLLEKDPEFGDIKLGQLDQAQLEQLSTSSIPGLDQTQLEQFAGWSNANLSDIQNLPEMPIGAIQPSLTMPVALHDSTWGPQEKFATYKPITGGDDAGYSVPCDTPRPGGGTGCATVELGDMNGSLGQLGLNGAHFVKGGKDDDAMETPGGFGDWKFYNNGKEPVGRPFGQDFKIVLLRTDENTDTADYGLYTRKCRYPPAGPPTCTPKAIGPFPFYSSKPGDAVFLGTPTFSQSSGNTASGSSSSSSSSSSSGSTAQSFKGESAAVAASQAVDDCDRRSLNVVDPNLSNDAAALVPRIIDEAQKAGLTNNQTALVLAVAEQKHYFNPALNPATLVGQVKGVAQKHITPSVVNYRAAAEALGLDVTSGGNLASEYQAALQPCANKACNPDGRFIRPTSGVVTSEMGMRLHPIYGVWRLHAGIDIADRAGTEVIASACGIVDFVGQETGYGTVVVIKHGTLFSRSAHLSATNVKVGQQVIADDRVGSQGATGGVTGPHLHWEIRKGGRWGEPQNPRNYAAI